MIGKSQLLKIKPYKPGKPIEELKRELKLKSVIKLASNENPLGPSKKAVEAIRKSLGALNRYPDSACFYLRNILAKKLKLHADNIICGNGSDELITFAIKAFVNKGDEVVMAKPTFLIYEIAALVSGGVVRAVDVKRDFKYDLVSMKRAITNRTKIVFIANPDNPLGTYVTKAEVAQFLSNLPEDLIVFFDEAYYEFARDLKDYPDTFKYLNRQNVIICRTFSKVYGLAGLRIGYAMANSEIIDYMNRVREPFNVNSLAQVGAIAALKDTDHVDRSLRLVREGKIFLSKQLKKLNFDVLTSATNFILVKLGPDCEDIYTKLLKKGIIVRDMSSWGLVSFMRLTIGTMEENRRFIKALREVL